jgi:16S rRNA (guanine527-N7)-methyltransferase
MNITEKYFPDLIPRQVEQYVQMERLYNEWNTLINVVSRKDIAQLATHHILHSMAIAKVICFQPGTSVMDAGTGGGFPGIPLAVLFPEVHFTLVDSIGKKIRVVKTIAQELHLDNVSTINARFETVTGSYDFVTGRAVSSLQLFFSMVKDRVNARGFNTLPNGILYLTGGEIAQDLSKINSKSTTWSLAGFFEEDYFSTKKLIHLHNF